MATVKLSNTYYKGFANILAQLDDIDSYIVAVMQGIEETHPTPPTADIPVNITILAEAREALSETISKIYSAIAPF